MAGIRRNYPRTFEGMYQFCVKKLDKMFKLENQLY